MPVIEEGLQHTNKIIAINMETGAGFETVQPYIDPQVEKSSIDMHHFNADQDGLYVMVNSFHQLSPKEAREVLQSVASRRQPIAVLEGNNDSLWQVVGMTIFVPLTVMLTAPFVRPFRISRLVFTYLIPILPIVTLVDGFLALFKLYAPKDLDELVQPIKVTDYSWRSGKLDNGRGGKIIYLLGGPVNSD